MGEVTFLGELHYYLKGISSIKPKGQKAVSFGFILLNLADTLSWLVELGGLQYTIFGYRNI